jgi:putative ABC transport system substrate-binding protein
MAAAISRRTFSGLLAAVLVTAPRVAFTQGSTAVRRLGELSAGEPDSSEDLRLLTQPLRELGWIEGKNLRVERRYANGGVEALNRLAEELVRAKVELIVTYGTAATLAAKRATTTIPIVFASAGDPVHFGLVASLARPGGNVTGFSTASPEVAAKSLSLLKDLLPKLRRIGVLESSANPYFRATRGQFEKTCQSLGLAPVFIEPVKQGLPNVRYRPKADPYPSSGMPQQPAPWPAQSGGYGEVRMLPPSPTAVKCVPDQAIP